jgi:hypothetical protein
MVGRLLEIPRITEVKSAFWNEGKEMKITRFEE